MMGILCLCTSAPKAALPQLQNAREPHGLGERIPLEMGLCSPGREGDLMAALATSAGSLRPSC